MVSLLPHIILQSALSAAVWAVPAYAAFFVVHRFLQRWVNSPVRFVVVYFLILTLLLAVARSFYLLPFAACPPSVDTGSIQTVENSCNAWANVGGLFFESLLRGAYISLLLVLFGMIGYAVASAVPLRNPYARGYVGTAVALFLFLLTMVVFPWIAAGWVSSSL